jgi:hypothetical protein
MDLEPHAIGIQDREFPCDAFLAIDVLPVVKEFEVLVDSCIWDVPLRAVVLRDDFTFSFPFADQRRIPVRRCRRAGRSARLKRPPPPGRIGAGQMDHGDAQAGQYRDDNDRSHAAKSLPYDGHPFKSIAISSQALPVCAHAFRRIQDGRQPTRSRLLNYHRRRDTG